MKSALEVGPVAHRFDHACEFAQRVCALFEIHAGVGGDALDLNAPVAGAFAGGLAGQALRRLENVDCRAFQGQLLGDGARNGAADLLVGVEEEHDFALEEAGFGEHLNGGEGHGHADLHIEGAGSPQGGRFGDAARHGAESAEGPDGVDVAEQQCGLWASVSEGAEARCDEVAELSLAVKADSSADGAGMLCDE